MRASPLAAFYGFMLSIALAACAASVEYTAKPVPVPIAGAMPGWVTERGLAVGADPYVQPERQEAFFGLRLGRMGVLPVQLLIRNDGDRGILVRPYEIALLLPDGRALVPVGAATAAAIGQGAPGQFNPVARSAAVQAILILAEVSTQRELNRHLYADYRAKELGEVTLNRNEFRHGFVYFILPPDTPSPADVTLLVRLIDTADATPSVVEVPFPRLDLRGPITTGDNGGKPQDGPRK